MFPALRDGRLDPGQVKRDRHFAAGVKSESTESCLPVLGLKLDWIDNAKRTACRTGLKRRRTDRAYRLLAGIDVALRQGPNRISWARCRASLPGFHSTTGSSTANRFAVAIHDGQHTVAGVQSMVA
jgi:hypothetical protein